MLTLRSLSELTPGLYHFRGWGNGTSTLVCNGLRGRGPTQPSVPAAGVMVLLHIREVSL